MKRSLKIITIVLIVVLIMLVSTLGIFKQHLNRMVNIIPDYKLSTELVGTRNYVLEVDTTEKTEKIYYDSEGNKVENVSDDTDTSAYTVEEKVTKTNEDDVLTKENYEKVKKIMQDRLAKLDVADYDIRLDKEKGTIMVSIPNNDDADAIYNSVGAVGKFEIVDKETEEVLMTNADLKNAEAVYNTQSVGTTVYLQLEFNNEGKEKLRKMSTEYVEKEVEPDSAISAATSDSDTEKEKETKISYVKVMFDGSALITTYFGEEMTNGILQIPITQSLTDTDSINQALKSVRKIANILNTGKLPITYKLANDNYVETRINDDLKNVAVTVFEIVNAALIIVLIAKNGKKGLLGAISHIGYASLLLLVIRYTNVTLSIGGFLAIIFMDVLYFIFLHQFINKLKTTKFVKKAFGSNVIDAVARTVPLIIISFVFTLTNNIYLSSMGMVCFWGIVLAILYSLIITKTLFNANED